MVPVGDSLTQEQQETQRIQASKKANILFIISTSLCFIIPHRRFNVNIFQITVSYIDSRRGFCLGRWCQDVHHRRARHRLRHGGECGVWNYILDNNPVLTQKA